PPPPLAPLSPYTTLFRSLELRAQRLQLDAADGPDHPHAIITAHAAMVLRSLQRPRGHSHDLDAVDRTHREDALLVALAAQVVARSEEHTSELQSPDHLVC